MVLGVLRALPGSCCGFTGLRGALCILFRYILMAGTSDRGEHKYEMVAVRFVSGPDA